MNIIQILKKASSCILSSILALGLILTINPFVVSADSYSTNLSSDDWDINVYYNKIADGQVIVSYNIKDTSFVYRFHLRCSLKSGSTTQYQNLYFYGMGTGNVTFDDVFFLASDGTVSYNMTGVSLISDDVVGYNYYNDEIETLINTANSRLSNIRSDLDTIDDDIVDIFKYISKPRFNNDLISISAMHPYISNPDFTYDFDDTFDNLPLFKFLTVEDSINGNNSFRITNNKPYYLVVYYGSGTSGYDSLFDTLYYQLTADDLTFTRVTSLVGYMSPGFVRVYEINSNATGYFLPVPKHFDYPYGFLYYGYAENLPDNIGQLVGAVKPYSQYFIELINGNAASQQKSSDLESKSSELDSAANDLEDFEQSMSQDLESNLDNLPTFNPSTGFGSKFLTSANFVKTQFDNMTTDTPFGIVITFSLVLGIALLIIGRSTR